MSVVTPQQAHQRKSSVRIPHFDLPFQFADQGDGTPSAVVVEQDSDAEVAVCVESVLSFEPGSRDEKPEFGTPDQTFASPTPDRAEYLASIAEWEPRAAAELDQNPDAYDELISHVRVKLSRPSTEAPIE